MPFTSITKPEVGDPTKKQSFADIVIDNLTYLYNQLIGSDSSDGLPNSSFENDVDTDGVPDQWVWNGTGGTVSLDSTAGNQKHGAKAVKITSTGSGGGYIETADFFATTDGQRLAYKFAMKCSAAGVATKVSIRYYDKDKVFISPEVAIYDNSASNPTTWTYQTILAQTPNTDARFAKIRLYGANSATSGSTWFDDLRIVGDNVFTKTPQVSIYSASGSFVVPDSISRIRVRIWGAGGGGGGGNNGHVAVAYPGGGGGGGAYSESNIAVTGGETLTVTVGAGGAGGTGGNAGTSGSLSQLLRSATNLISANGGAGGATPSAAPGTGGAGGTVGTGTFAQAGQSGSPGITDIISGAGGAAPLAGGAGGAPTYAGNISTDGVAGRAGRPFGGGGGGGGAASGTGRTGGDGAAGGVIIDY